MSPTTKPPTGFYTPGDVSELLEIPASTLRHWASKVYQAHLSPYAAQRRRQYTQQDLETIARIKIASDKGILVDDIKKELGEIKIVDIQAEHGVSTNLALIPALAHQQTQLDEISAKLDKLLSQAESRSWWDRLRGK